MAANLREGSRLKLVRRVAEIVRRGIAEGRRWRDPLGRIGTSRDNPKQFTSLATGCVGRPRRAMAADSKETLAPADPILENINGIAALATDAKAPNGGIPNL
jgi:hypothetical protein